jgi:glycosyltransferase involved in cell wall biosynthesis
MAAGRPCITTDLPGNHEWLGDEGGWYAPAGDPEALARAILSSVRTPPDLRQRASEYNRRQVAARAVLPANFPRLLAALRALAVPPPPAAVPASSPPPFALAQP